MDQATAFTRQKGVFTQSTAMNLEQLLGRYPTKARVVSRLQSTALAQQLHRPFGERYCGCGARDR